MDLPLSPKSDENVFPCVFRLPQVNPRADMLTLVGILNSGRIITKQTRRVKKPALFKKAILNRWRDCRADARVAR